VFPSVEPDDAVDLLTGASDYVVPPCRDTDAGTAHTLLMRRVLAVLVGAGIAMGGGAAAWAATSDEGGRKREAAKACLSQARQEAPDVEKGALKEAVKACLNDGGIERRAPTPEQRAKREELRNCLQGAKALRPQDNAAARAAARACLEQAGGVTRGRMRERLPSVKECLAEARTEQPDASKADRRALVKECLAAKGP